MNIPQLTFGETGRDALTSFFGLNLTKRISDAEFCNMKNMSGRNFPCLSPREKRAVIKNNVNVQCLTAKEQLCWIEVDNDTLGARFFYGGIEIEAVSAALLHTNRKRQTVSMGANIVIFPDKIMYNCRTGELTYLEQSVEAPAGMTMTLCKQDGTSYSSVITISDELPSGEIPNGTIVLDASGDTPVLKIYSASTGTWGSVGTTFVKLSSPALADAHGNPIFKPYDAVKISGMTDNQFNTTMVVWASGGSDGSGWVVVTGIFGVNADGNFLSEITQTTSASVLFERVVPDMDYVVESDNRLWGCKFSGSTDEAAVNEIYASKLGDATNWNCFMGLASDSYAVSVGSDGKFTGAAVQDGYILFFKENTIHKIYGSKPSNFQVTAVAARGVKDGCAGSLCIVGEQLLYLAKTEVCSYSGGNPMGISDALGDKRFTNAVAGVLGSCYYICMTDSATEERELYCYDTATRLWHKEDEVDIDCFATLKENLYCAGEGQVCVINGESYDGTLEEIGAEAQVEWFAETGDIGFSRDDSKYYSLVQVRLEADSGTQISIAFSYDGSKFIEKYKASISQKKAFTIPFVSPRCDRMRIRISGKGNATIYSISKHYESGGDVKNG